LWSECAVTELIQQWHEAPGKGLMISGDMGTGKTVIMGMMMACLASRNEFSFSCWHTGALLSFLLGWREWGADEAADARMELLRSAKYLFLDDLGVEYNAPLAMSQFNELMEVRYSRELLHVGSSNLNEDALIAREGWVRVIDRIQESAFEWCEIGGPSKRRMLL
jgi:DNA replication protein DnaC